VRGHTSRIFFVRIDHAELDRKITLLVSNDGIVKLRHTLGGLDVLDPALRFSWCETVL